MLQVTHSRVAYNIAKLTINTFDINMGFRCKVHYTQCHHQISIRIVVARKYEGNNGPT